MVRGTTGGQEASLVEKPEYNPLIRDLPAGERPRERLREKGARNLSNAELLAIILRVGSARQSVLDLSSRLLARFGGLPGLAKASFQELCDSGQGMGEAKTSQLKAALELGSRLVATGPEERAVVRCPQDVANLLSGEMGFLEQESLRVVLLNTKNQVMGMPEVYRGSVNTSHIRTAEIFKEAVRANCPAIIVVHNHPSGDPTPSADDVAVTRQMLDASKLLDIELLDHLVLGQKDWVSLKEKGLAFG